MSKPNAAGNVHAYEVCAIFDASLDDKKAGILFDQYLEIVTKDGGTVEKTDNWGRRKLAYPINKQTEGIYIFVNFNAKSATTDEFVRRLGLDENTLRYKVFRNEAK